VTSARGWSVDRGPDACTTYCWLSDHEVLHFGSGSHGGTSLFRADVRSQSQTECRRLAVLFRETHGDPDGLVASPDARYVLWHGSSQNMVLASVDGNTLRQYFSRAREVGEYYWLGTIGSRWIAILSEYEYHVRPFVRTTVRDPDVPTQDPTVIVDRASFDVRPGGVVTQDGDGLHLLGSEWGSESPRAVSQFAQLSRYSLIAPHKPPQVVKWRLPRNAVVVGRAISRDARRVAWLLHIDTVSPFEELLDRLLRRTPKERPTLGIWVSEVEQPGIEEIGHLAVTGPHPESPDMLDGDTLQWLPGSKKLSFVYKDQLYVVDAP